MFKNATASKSEAQVLCNGLALACFKRILCHKKIAENFASAKFSIPEKFVI